MGIEDDWLTNPVPSGEFFVSDEDKKRQEKNERERQRQANLDATKKKDQEENPYKEIGSTKICRKCFKRWSEGHKC